jgi:prepilin-type N-terminal cleavage/methylation domain-containing protein
VKQLRNRLGIDGRDDSGFTLVEVIVAMVIFAIVSTSILYGMLSVLKITRDSRAQQVASNLAAEEIDLARAADDLFLLDDYTYPPRTLNGDIFTVKREARWVTDPAQDLQCGSGGTALRYKSIKVIVTWQGMASANGVESYTVINPAERINDPAKGTIIVTVRSPNGSGVSGAAVSATPAVPPNGATALSVTPSATNSQGCSYILKVNPGNYTVTASKAGYVDVKQKPLASVDTTVTIGNAVAVDLTYGLASTYPVNLATNGPSDTKIPTNLRTTMISSLPPYYDTTTVATRARSFSLFPTAYEAIAGNFVPSAEGTPGCPAVDPASWPAILVGVDTYASFRPPAAVADPGATAAPTNVKMGIFTITGDSSANRRYIKAISQDRTPRCEVSAQMTYTFGNTLGTSTGTKTTFALPYGSWLLYYGDSSSQTTVVGASRMALVTGQRGSIGSDNVILLDPRSKQ